MTDGLVADTASAAPAGSSSAAPPTLAEAAWELGFAPLPLEDGLRLREGDAWRHLPAPTTAPDGGPGAARYRALLSVADLDAFLATEAARSGRVTMAEGGRQGSAGVPEDLFIRDDGRVDLPRLHALFDAGSTLVVSQFHELHPALARFCRGLERVFLHAVQSNIYLTPPGAQGFRVHYDTHDVLVLQVQGEKIWRIFPGQPIPQPTRRTPWRNGTEPLGEPESVTMRAGDALYIPRGVMHDAAAQDVGEASLHITVGFLEVAWADALRAALELLEAESPALRASFPTWRLAEGEGPAAFAASAAPLLAALGAPAVLERVAMGGLDRLAYDRLPLSGRGLLSAPPGPGDRLRLSDSMHHHLVPLDDGGAELRWAGEAVRLDAAALDWLGRLEDGATVAELGEGAAAFCARLRASGLLVPAEG